MEKNIKYILNSGIRVAPKITVKLVLFVMYFFMFMTSLILLVKLLIGEIRLSDLLYLLLFYVVIKYYKFKMDMQACPVITQAELLLTDDLMKITYFNVVRNDRKGPREEVFTAYYNDINNLEFSDQLNCLRIIGNIEMSTNYIEKSRNTSNMRLLEHYFYIEKDMVHSILYQIKMCTGQSIIYMDKK